MIAELKKKLIEDPELIRSLLEEFNFEHINIRGNNIRFARNLEGGQNISIRLSDEYLNVTDFVRGDRTDIISYIIREKETDFKSVISVIKRILNIPDDWIPASKRFIFGGAYAQITHKEYIEQEIYGEDILNSYLQLPNERFRMDNISLKTQLEWNIGYDVESSRITIPIRNEAGQIVGIKARANYDSDDVFDPKYLYLKPCKMSMNLFGYSENYSNIYGKTIMIFESEKSVLQCASYGYRNAVAIGSNNLSEKQAKLILQLQPEHIIFMLDNDLPFENTRKNIETLHKFSVMRNLRISYFDWEETLDLPEKASPSDEGKEVLDNILENCLKDESELWSDDDL